MTELNSLTIDHLRARGSQKWNRYPADVLPLWIAEMDYPLAAPVREAIDRTIAAEGWGYAEIGTELFEAFQGFAARRLNMDARPEWTVTVPDVLTGVEVALDVHSPAGAPVVVPTPAYMPFLDVPTLIGRQLVTVPLREDPSAATVAERWSLDLAAIEAAFAAGARSIILCQPYNPVGKILGREELQALAELAETYGAWVVSDEIHAPLTLPGFEHLPFSSVSELAASRCTTVTSASKSFSMPGLPCATVTHHTAEASERFNQLAPHGHLYGATILGINANIAAFTSGDAWLDEVNAQVSANQRVVDEWLRRVAPQACHTPAQATYFAWLDWREAGLGDEPAAWFETHARVRMNEGSAFGEAGRGFTRLNLATTPAILAEALGRMEGALVQR